jgi:hypothetical protein
MACPPLKAEVVLFGALSACSFDPSGTSAGPTDAAPADGAPDAQRQVLPVHLLLTEVKSAPDALEFIEIYNPTCTDVDLTNYYLGDEPTYPLAPSWGTSRPIPGTLNAVLRFPPGEILAAGAVAVVARDAIAFAAEYGALPRFALLNGGETAMEFIVYRSTPDMILANTADVVVLFTWDGMGDLVRDVDIVVAGDAPTTRHELLAKQVLAPRGVDGPDEGDAPTAYLPDGASLPAMQARDTEGSYERIAFEGEYEAASGGNGLEGHDETSEDTRNTWEEEPGTMPTPGEVPESLSVSCLGQ